MARYVSLLRFTDQGARNNKKSTARASAFKKAAAKAGVRVELQLWTLGREDGVLILSGDEQRVLRLLAQLSALGNIRTETMQAFDAKDFMRLIRR